jgi:hypothetical protein
MKITDVAWVRDHHGQPALDLRLDGHPAHIRSSQKTELTQRGLLDGIVFLNSERGSQVPNIYVQGNYAPAYEGLELVGCTDNPQVFALFQAMCQAIRTDRWREGAQPMAV